MKIQVTAQDIAQGCRGKCELCPVALAVRRAVGHDNVYVDINTYEAKTTATLSVAVGSTGEWKYRLPDKVKDFINDFDMGYYLLVKPFEFDLDDNLRIYIDSKRWYSSLAQ